MRPYIQSRETQEGRRLGYEGDTEKGGVRDKEGRKEAGKKEERRKK